MRLIYRLVLAVLLAFMFRTPLLRLQHTARQFVKVIPETISSNKPILNQAVDMSERPNGTIANKGLELLTFGTPNG